MEVFGAASSTLDFDSDGKRTGFIDVSHSDNRHAFSSIRLPVGVIKGGPGPTVLLTAGSHGDEYEGQVLLYRLMERLTPEQVPGRLILLPALNLPAVLAQARVSPLDQGNMNRSFPGKADAGPTQAIAGFVNNCLIDRADAVLDFHSGGTATEYVSCAFLGLGQDQSLNLQNLELARLFGAPYTMVRQNDGSGGDFDTAAYRKSVQFLSCELGGMGRFSPDAFQIGWEGCLRILKALGTVRDDIFGETAPPDISCFIDIGGGADHVTSDRYAIAAIDVCAGTRVSRGQTLGQIHETHGFGSEAIDIVAPRAGIVAIRRRNPLVEPGDHLCLIAEEITREGLLGMMSAKAPG